MPRRSGPTPVFAIDWTNGTTARDGTTPTTATRLSGAYRTDWDGSKHTLTWVGNNVIRVGSYNDGTTTYNNAEIEAAATNLALDSSTILTSGSNWALVRADTATSTTISAPDPSEFAAELTPRVFTGNNCRIAQTISVSTSTQYTASVYLRAGSQDWAFLQLTSFGGGNAAAYFQLTGNGSVGTTLNSAAYIEQVGGGWYRAILVATSNGTGGSTEFQIWPAEANSDLTFTSDGSTVTTYLWGAQLETGSYATSYIPTTSASATRAADDLRYPVSLTYPLTIDTYAAWTQSNFPAGIVSLSDGGVSGDRVLLYSPGGTNSGLFSASAEGGGANITGGTATRNTWHRLTGTVDLDAFELFFDGSSIGTDSSGAPPNDLDRLNVGAYQSAGNILNGRVGPIEIYDEVVTP